MKRRTRQFVILIALVIAIAVLWGALRAPWATSRAPGEPSYRGRLLSEWLDDRVATPAGPVILTDEAVFAVRQIGPEAIPLLLEWLQRSDPRGFQQLRYSANIPVPLNDRWRDRAFLGFRALGDDAAIAIPELVHLALRGEDRDIRSAAINSLTNDHPASTKLLSKALRDNDAEIRFRAAHVLGCIRPPAAIGSLTSALGDPDSNVRSESARALGFYSRPLLPARTLDALESLLLDRDPSVRAAARSALNSQTAYREARKAASDP